MLVDRSNAGRLRVGGEDRLAFLHGQSTNDLQALQPGQGCDTVRRAGGTGRSAGPGGWGLSIEVCLLRLCSVFCATSAVWLWMGHHCS